MSRACSTNIGGEKCINVILGKSEGMRPFGKLMVNNIKTERGCSVLNWVDLAQDRELWRALVNTSVNLLVTQSFGNFLTSSETGSSIPWSRL
jgi:hypothetical protein